MVFTQEQRHNIRQERADALDQANDLLRQMPIPPATRVEFLLRVADWLLVTPTEPDVLPPWTWEEWQAHQNQTDQAKAGS